MRGVASAAIAFYGFASAPVRPTPIVAAPTVGAATVAPPIVGAPIVAAPTVAPPTVAPPTVAAQTVGSPTVGAAQIQISMATLHAASRSTARTPRDSADAPYLLVTVLGPGTAKSDMQMPTINTHWAIRKDEVKGAAPLTSLALAPGDSVRVLFPLLESPVNASGQTTTGSARPNSM